MSVPLDIQMKRHFYRPFCTESEIDRVMSPRTARDFLLKMRADYIADHMRVLRYYRRLSIIGGARYSLERSFSTKHYREYKMSLPREDREVLAQVAYGDIFTSEPNGHIFKSQFGRIVTISRSIEYFLKFSHLALLDFDEEVPPQVRFQALLIALRVMFQNESLDFDVDPRGILPDGIARSIHKLIPIQLQFIVGHEFAHHLLGHLNDQEIRFAGNNGSKDGQSFQDNTACFSVSEVQEIDADLNAIMRPRITESTRLEMLNGVILWLGALELFEHALSVMRPYLSGMPRTHPTARNRHLHILNNVDSAYKRVVQEISDSTIHAVDSYKSPLAEYLGLNMDEFETYGSCYLAEPNTEWRGRRLVDRVDYY